MHTSLYRSIVITSILLSSAMLANKPSQAQGNITPDIMVVFDASGSMWGQIDGVAKIEIARKAFKGLSTDWSARGVSAGLMAYGHRRKGDCSDIELISRPSTSASAAMASQIQGLKPKGKTPLSAAVRQAADVLKFQENAATVVLLSDGIETCNLNPCAIGKELEDLGINFTAHVIGFGIQKEADKSQLKCLAENTGGKYFDARDANELNGALKEVASAPRQELEALPVASISGPTTTAINSIIPVEWTGPAGQEDFVDIQIAGDPRTSNQPSSTSVTVGSPAQLKAPGKPGFYELRYVQFKNGEFKILTRTLIEVIDQEYVVNTANSGVAGSEINISWSGQAQNGDYIDVMPAAKGNSTIGVQSYVDVDDKTSGTIELPVTPGEYNMRYILEATDGRVIKFSKPFKVEQVSATLRTVASVKPGAEIPVLWDGPRTRGDYVDLVPAGQQRIGGELSFFYTKGDSNSGTLKAPNKVGSYEIRYILEGASIGRAMIGKTQIVVDSTAPEAALPDTQTQTTITVKAQYADGKVPDGPASWSFYKNGEHDVRAPITPSGNATFEGFEYGNYRAEVVIDNESAEIFGEAQFSLVEGGRTDFKVIVKFPTPGDNQSTEDVQKSLQEASKDGGEDASTMISEEELDAENTTGSDLVVPSYPLEVWAQCVGRSSCYFLHKKTNFGWSMPPEWVAEEPFFYTTAGGTKADQPTLQMALRPKGKTFRVALNPHQWTKALGPCENVARGILCRTAPIEAGDFDNYETIRTGLNELSGAKPLTFNEVNDALKELTGK